MGLLYLGQFKQKKMNDPPVQAMFKRSRHNTFYIFKISQGYYEIPEETIRAKGNIYHRFEPNNFRDVPNLYQDKGSMDMTPNEFKLLTSTCQNEKYQPLTMVMTGNKYTGPYILR